MKLNAPLLNLNGQLKIGNAPVASSLPHLYGVGEDGIVKRVINSFGGQTVYQLGYIHSSQAARIELQYLRNTTGDLIGLELGSYNARFEFEFGNLDNANFRLSARRVIEFAFTIYPFAGANRYSLPVVYSVSNAGCVVNITNNASWELSENDIVIEPVLVSNRLCLDIKSFFNAAPFSAANAAFQARYITRISKFNYQSGGGSGETTPQ